MNNPRDKILIKSWSERYEKYKDSKKLKKLLCLRFLQHLYWGNIVEQHESRAVYEICLMKLHILHIFFPGTSLFLCDSVVSPPFPLHTPRTHVVYRVVGGCPALIDSRPALHLLLAHISFQLVFFIISSPTPTCEWKGYDVIVSLTTLWLTTLSVWWETSTSQPLKFSN